MNLQVAKDFTRASYFAALAAQPSTANLTTWSAALGAAYPTGFTAFLAACAAQIAGLFASADYTARARTNDQFVDDCYLAYFGRLGSDDAIGHATWLAYLVAHDRAATTTAFAATAEFSERISVEFDIAVASDSDFERLLFQGDFGWTEEIEFQVLEADYGDGYDDGALIGSTEGTRSWKLTYKVLHSGINATPGEPAIFSAQSKATYLWNFFCRQMSQGNKSFIIRSLKDGKDYLAAFVDKKLSYEMFASRLYTTGVQLKQRRERGVTLT